MGGDHAYDWWPEWYRFSPRGDLGGVLRQDRQGLSPACLGRGSQVHPYGWVVLIAHGVAILARIGPGQEHTATMVDDDHLPAAESGGQGVFVGYELVAPAG